MADEVYQVNIFDPENHPFHSFKKVVRELDSKVELFSIHSISKGMIGECGRRGGYYEAVNIGSDISAQLLKMSAVTLCPSTHGQIAVDIMVDPPRKGDLSYVQYQAELDAIHQSLKRRATKLCEAFNSLENMTCNIAEGAMYLFPQIHMPQKAKDEAAKDGKSPDFIYCMGLLESTGVVGIHNNQCLYDYKSLDILYISF